MAVCHKASGTMIRKKAGQDTSTYNRGIREGIKEKKACIVGQELVRNAL